MSDFVYILINSGCGWGEEKNAQFCSEVTCHPMSSFSFLQIYLCSQQCQGGICTRPSNSASDDLMQEDER